MRKKKRIKSIIPKKSLPKIYPVITRNIFKEPIECTEDSFGRDLGLVSCTVLELKSKFGIVVEEF